MYDPDGNKMTYEDIFKSASEFWGVENDGYMPKPKNNKLDLCMDFMIFERIQELEEGLVEWEDVLGAMLAALIRERSINTRTIKNVVDYTKDYIRLLRYWKDKGYRAYSTRWERDDCSDDAIKWRKEWWEKRCPPSYLEFGEANDFNPDFI